MLVPCSHIVSARKECNILKPTKTAGFIAVRFRSGAFRYFCHQAMNELSDRFVDVKSVWGKSGEEMTERVITAASLEERVKIIDMFMLKYLAQYAKPSIWLDQIINEIYYNFTAIQLQEKYQAWGISDRKLQRKFKEAVGISPKAFQRNARFQAVVKECLLERRQDYLAIALDKGYYDQSHFIKDFQYFIGETPAAFFQENNFMSHFYNRSFQRYSKI